MSKPSAGNYYIVNRQTTPDGTSLAITYNGENAILTVTEFGSQPTQVWVITDNNSGEVQTISPQDATSLEVDYKGSENLTVLPVNGYAWAIRGTDGIYTIQDGGFKVFWGLKEAAVGQAVIYGPGTDSVEQDWQLISA